MAIDKYEKDNSAKPPSEIKSKYSAQQTIQISNIPGDYNRNLSLDNAASLVLIMPSNADVVTLAWPTTARLRVDEPTPGERLKIPGSESTIRFSPNLEVKGMESFGPSRKIQWDTKKNVTRLLRIGDRIFRIALEEIRDKRSVQHAMFFEYVFAITEEEATYENRRRSITGDDFGPENILQPFRDQAEGTVELKIRETANDKPNRVLIKAGGKMFLFDPVTRQLEFRMVTKDGRSITLQRRIDTAPDDVGRHSIEIRWDEMKGGQLWIGGQVMKDGLN